MAQYTSTVHWVWWLQLSTYPSFTQFGKTVLFAGVVEVYLLFVEMFEILHKTYHITVHHISSFIRQQGTAMNSLPLWTFWKSSLSSNPIVLDYCQSNVYIYFVMFTDSHFPIWVGSIFESNVVNQSVNKKCHLSVLKNSNRLLW